MKQHIKINITDCWKSFKPLDNFFVKFLGTYYDLEFSENPDFLIYSCYNRDGYLRWRRGSRQSAAEEFRKYDCIRIFFTLENVRPNFSECDYAFTYDYNDHPNHYRLPFYGIYSPNCNLPFIGIHDTHPLIRTETFNPELELKKKTKFCNFVYSNMHGRKRNRFFHKLSKYKQVDSGGKWLNNLGHRVKNKLEFLSQYKFTIAFENYSYPGYTTEKIVQPMLVNSLPIYWGNPLIHRDFNTQSFLNSFDFHSEKQLIEKIVELDQNDDAYLEYLKQPNFTNNTVNHFINPKNILDQFDRIFNTPKTPVAQTRRKIFFFLR
ncbi:MAG: glycosyltransferase [Cyanothece sp. SIO1E1]|nr:glycosyltransferase [Cyanothece sp. SIO1E1]